MKRWPFFSWLKKSLPKSSDDFLDSVIENIPNMIFVKDAKELRFVKFNKAGEELLGYKRESLLGKNDYDFFPREQADFFTQNDRAVLEGGQVVDIPEEPIQTRTGIRFLHTKKIPWFDANGKPIYLLGISEDITDRKAAEDQKLKLLQEQMARSEAEKIAERLRLLSEASHVLNQSLNSEQILQKFADVVSKQFADFCIIDVQTEAGKPESFVVSHRDPSMITAMQQWRELHPLKDDTEYGPARVMKTGAPEIYQEITPEAMAQQSGSKRGAELAQVLQIQSVLVVPLNIGKRVLGAVTLLSSNRERRFSHLDLAIAQDLASRASLALENSRLYEKAQEANRAKTAFLANMSHEVRTPLAAVLGFARIINDDNSLPEEHRRNMALITRNGKQLLNIVDEILDISKIESDRMELEEILFNLRTLLSEIMALFSVRARDKRIRLFLDCDANVPQGIVSDPTRLRQILINIVGNAIKFTESGSVKVHVSMYLDDAGPGRHRLSFRVADSGIGLTSSEAESLFQPFAQADSSTTRRFGGTGLGLFLSRKMARILGGDLVLERSAPGEGSVFVLTIETKVIQAKMAEPETASVKSHDLPRLKGRVLVIDDSEDNRFLVGWHLKRLGFECTMAGDGIEGLRKAEVENYNLILLDIQMPGMDGFEVLKIMKDQGLKIPVLALTAHAMKGDRERCLNAGFDGYLTKPIEEEKLLQSLTKYSASN